MRQLQSCFEHEQFTVESAQKIVIENTNDVFGVESNKERKKVATTKKVEDGGEMNERRFPNNIFFPIDTKNCAEGRLESGQRKKMLRVKFCFGRESKIKLQPMINLC